MENNLPEPRIVETPGTLGGRPRIDGTRIGVEHIWLFHERGDDASEIAKRHFRFLSEAHVSEAIEWAQEHPDRMAAIRCENMELQLQHDIFHSAVKAAIEECLEEIWSVLVNVRSRDADALTPIASLLRNGFENADGLDVDIDTDTGQVIIDVADELVASREGTEESTDE